MMFGRNRAPVSTNIGLMWVAIELATLTTVMMVGIYRTPQALEAAWKYFILGSVGIALALFGTILVYMAARPVVGEGLDGQGAGTSRESDEDGEDLLPGAGLLHPRDGCGSAALRSGVAWVPAPGSERCGGGWSDGGVAWWRLAPACVG